jgi:hypothetical protein
MLNADFGLVLLNQRLLLGLVLNQRPFHGPRCLISACFTVSCSSISACFTVCAPQSAPASTVFVLSISACFTVSAPISAFFSVLVRNQRLPGLVFDPRPA